LIQPIPAGLKMIAGDAKNDKDVWKGGLTTWVGSPYVYKCLSTRLGYSLKTTQQIEAVPGRRGLQLWMVVQFPQCWDGATSTAPTTRAT
jgi:hypothetical protein